MIKQEGDKWCLYSKDGSKKLGTFDSEEEAKEREKQVQAFKQKSQEAAEARLDFVVSQALSLTRLEEFSKPGDVETLISTFGEWAGGSVATCTEKLTGKEGVDDAPALCAWLKDQAVGGTEEKPTEVQTEESGELVMEKDSAGGHAVALVESGEGGPITLDVELIQPGWGNPRDGHFYPKETLQKASDLFVGAKMYESNHRPDEMSTRTWVSTIKEMVGFSERGAPIGRVIVHDPSFAARVTNLAKGGLLERMEASINALGSFHSGEVEGRKGKIIENITEVKSVDWVTRAGAGGKVIGLVESVDGQALAEIQEGGSTALAREQVLAVLQESRLPSEFSQLLGAQEYETAEALREAIDKVRRGLKTVTGSGGVFGFGGSRYRTSDPDSDSPTKLVEAQREILKSYGITAGGG